MRFTKRWFGYVGIGVAVAAVGWWLWRPAVVVIDIGEVSSGPLTVAIEEEGETRVRDRFVVAAPVSGRLERIAVRAGDSVRAGTPVARITPAPLDPRTRRELTARLEAALDGVRTARAEVARTQAALEQAARERARLDRLHQQNVIAAETRERAELAETAAREAHVGADFRAQAAAHEVEETRAALSSADGGGAAAVLHAPVAGRVLRVAESSERVVLAGTPVVELGDPRVLEVVVPLLSTDAVKVAAGDTVQLTGWGRDDTLCAIVSRIEPSAFTKVSALGVEEQRVNLIGAVIDPPEALGDRFRVDAAIVTWSAARATRVPRSALFRADNAWHVFLVSDGRAADRQVTIGRQGRELAEVLDDLAVGDRVILHPDERVSAGTRVRPRERQSQE